MLIPGGLLPYLQPLDIFINKVFKIRVKEQMGLTLGNS